MSESLSSYPIVIATPSQAFFHLVLHANKEAYRLSFSVKAEANIRCYIVEGSHDLVSFESLTRVYAKGNSNLPCSYSALIHETSYKYYRVRQVNGTSSARSTSNDVLEPTLHVQEPLAQGCLQKAEPVISIKGGTHIHGAFF